MNRDESRRRFFATIGSLGAGALGLAAGTVARRASAAHPERPQLAPAIEPDVEGEDTPLEDLMREHALLERILLIYEEGCARLEARAEFDPAILARAGTIVRRYIEEHHERDEERHIFPRLEQVGACVELCATLRLQHRAGRRLTDVVIGLGSVAALRDPGARRQLTEAMRRFIRMYRPHAAQENTVVFAALRKAVWEAEYQRLRKVLEREERETLGEQACEQFLVEVHGLERALGIDEIAAFTPPPSV
jgi:hemerythrin-like domain-containing protein